MRDLDYLDKSPPICGKGFYAEDGTVHDCWLNQGHDGPHRRMEWIEVPATQSGEGER